MKGRRILCGVLDGFVLAMLAVVARSSLLAVAWWSSVPFAFERAPLTIQLIILAAAIGLRYGAGRAVPFLGFTRFGADTCRCSDTRGVRRLSRTRDTAVRQAVARPRSSRRGGLHRQNLAWQLPGFFSGDDVEIHLISMGALYGQHWRSGSCAARSFRWCSSTRRSGPRSRWALPRRRRWFSRAGWSSRSCRRP